MARQSGRGGARKGRKATGAAAASTNTGEVNAATAAVQSTTDISLSPIKSYTSSSRSSDSGRSVTTRIFYH